MGKKKKQKGKEDVEAILKRAEKLFQKGSYLLAKREFEKIEDLATQPDILDKISVCDREIRITEAEESVRRAKKLMRGGNPQQALACFESAYEVLREDWILERIERLKGVSARVESTRAAVDAEKAGEYLKAAQLYATASEEHELPELTLKMAGCLVKAKQYEEAVAAFERVPPATPPAWYGYGFSLSKTGRYFHCLQAWQNIPSDDPAFVSQKNLISGWLAFDLFARFKRGNDPGRIYEEAAFLKQSGYEAPGLSKLVQQSLLAWMERLWEEDRYHDIARVLPELSEDVALDLVPFRARVYFKVAEHSGQHVEELARLWLPAVYSYDFEKQDLGNASPEAARRDVVQRAEKWIYAWADHAGDPGRRVRAEWDMEKALAEDLWPLFQEQPKLNRQCLLPRMAEQHGMSERICRLIRRKRALFKDQERWLRAGCCFTPARKSFYHVVRGQGEAAVDALPPQDDQDEFVAYARGRAWLAYLMSCREEGMSPSREFVKPVVYLFKILPSHERQWLQMVQESLKSQDIHVLQSTETALQALYAARPSKAIGDALSLVMSNRAIEMALEGMLHPKALATTLKAAVDINPQNEHATGLLEDVDTKLAVTALHKALDKHKMSTAVKIVLESPKEGVREAYFEYFTDVLDELEEAEMSPVHQAALVHEFYKWCARVDQDHDILYRMEDMLTRLEGTPSP